MACFNSFTNLLPEFNDLKLQNFALKTANTFIIGLSFGKKQNRNI